MFFYTFNMMALLLEKFRNIFKWTLSDQSFRTTKPMMMMAQIFVFWFFHLTGWNIIHSAVLSDDRKTLHRIFRYDFLVDFLVWFVYLLHSAKILEKSFGAFQVGKFCQFFRRYLLKSKIHFISSCFKKTIAYDCVILVI